MNRDTITLLNAINHRFYEQTSEAFDATRQSAWEGWSTLAPLLLKKNSTTPNLAVLDIGCGNGRWASFLKHTLQSGFFYHGVDFNPYLLQKAAETCAVQSIKHSFKQSDVVLQLLNNKQIASSPTDSVDIVTAFGLIHHIPSFALRKLLISSMHQVLKPGGICIFAAWQFTKDPQLLSRAHTLDFAHVPKDQSEENDYILDWKRSVHTYRYCHLVDTQELQQLINPQEWKVIQEFDADGKEKLNHYAVMEKL